MSDQTFALLTIAAVAAGMSITTGIIYLIVVRSIPVKRRATARSSNADPLISPDQDAARKAMVLHLKDNAAKTAQIARDAKRLALQIEQLSKEIVASK